MTKSTRNQIILLIFSILILTNNVEAGTPVVSISASVSPSEIEAGSSGVLTVKVSETGGNDWIKNPSVIVQASPSEGISFPQTSQTVSRIGKSSSNTFYFNFNTEKTVSIGTKNIQITLQYYEMDLFNIETYGPFSKYSTAAFNIRPSVGILEITSSPSSAEVYLDGAYKGITPITISKVLIGSYNLALKKSGYNEISKSVTVRSGQTTYVSESLIELAVVTPVKSKPSSSSGVNSLPDTSSGMVSEPFGSFGLFGYLIAGFVVLLAFGAIYRNKTNKKSDSLIEPVEITESEPQGKYIPNSEELVVEKTNELPPIIIKSASEYKGAKIYYKVKIGNNTFETIGDIKINLFVPDVFLLLEKEKLISMLEPKENKTVTFEIRPTGECGDCNVSGKIEYYDYATKGRKMLDIENKSLSVICPVLKRKEIDVEQWEKVTDELIKAEENIKELSAPAENLFNITSRVIKDNGMFMLKPEITSTPQLFNGLAMFYAEGVTGLRYATYMEVVGGVHKSRMILKVWAEKEEALTGFYHRILDEIEKRIDVKIFIDDTIVQQHIHIGDKIETQVKDSFVQRSNIGVGARKCPNCGREINANETFCMDCGARL